MSKSDMTALVTGANSGLGFEAAAQLAQDGWGTVILACRSDAKADDARARLKARTGRDPFRSLVIDTSEVDSAHIAADRLRDEGVGVDFLLLNAGASGKDARFNSAGVEVTYASTLVGHHVLTMRLLADGLLTAHARVVIAGSEGARGNLPGMTVHDVAALARDSFDGDRAAAIEALFRLEAPSQTKFVNMSEYVTAKLIVAWWAAALARRLPAGMTVNAVSPGSVLSTGFARDAPAAIRWVMMPIFKLIGPLMGTAGSIEAGARRYLDAADYDDGQTGQFYATAHPKKLVGPVGIQTEPAWFGDEQSQEAALTALTRVTEIGLAAAA